MPKTTLVLLCLGAALFAVAPAAASLDPSEVEMAVAAVNEVDPAIEASAPSAGQDSVLGAGVNETSTLALSATSGPLGENPSGRGTAVAPGTRVHFEVTCLAVAGNLASIGGIVISGNLLPAGTELIFFVRDSGLPGGEGDGSSAITLPADSCAGLVGLAAGVPAMERGNFIVHDALAQ